MCCTPRAEGTIAVINEKQAEEDSPTIVRRRGRLEFRRLAYFAVDPPGVGYAPETI